MKISMDELKQCVLENLRSTCFDKDDLLCKSSYFIASLIVKDKDSENYWSGVIRSYITKNEKIEITR